MQADLSLFVSFWKCSLWVCIFTGPVCGKLEAAQKNVTLKTNAVTVTFTSGPHRSGRGFLLSYATDQYPGTTDLNHSAKLFATCSFLQFCVAMVCQGLMPTICSPRVLQSEMCAYELYHSLVYSGVILPL